MPDPQNLLALVARIRHDLDALEAEVTGAALPQRQTVNAAMGLPEPAPDADLDSQYGDPEVRTMPKDWQGQNLVGAKYSQCPPDFLKMLAGLLMWQARKDEEAGKLTAKGHPVADFKRKDAARALGWLRRIESARAPRRPAGPSGVTGRGSMADEGEPPPF
jgi:hypothetical protein